MISIHIQLQVVNKSTSNILNQFFRVIRFLQAIIMSKLVALFALFAIIAVAYALPQPQILVGDSLGLGLSPVGLGSWGGLSPIGLSSWGGVPIGGVSSLGAGTILLKK